VLLAALRGEVYAWIDSLSPGYSKPAAASLFALEWGRLGDRRAVKPLCQLTLDEHAATDARTEAARLLGKLADDSAADSLLAATRSPSRWVSARQPSRWGGCSMRAQRRRLRRLVAAEDPGIRSRAAISLGRLLATGPRCLR